MKILSKTLAAFTLLVCICFINVNSASAKVCFASDPGCSGGADFGTISPLPIETECAQEGFNVLASVCRSTPGQQIGAYCPYSNKYVKCCGLEYAYNSCVFPLITGQSPAKCGDKVRCKCDSGKYPYYYNPGTLISNCPNNSVPGGATCSYLISNGTGTLNQNQYTDCNCDRSFYPKEEKDCTFPTEGGGNSCTAKNNGLTTNYYQYCRCQPSFGTPITSATCFFGYKNGATVCTDFDGTKRVKEADCCQCDSSEYPYSNPPSEATDRVRTYTSCTSIKGCKENQGNRYKATSCSAGYALKNGQCIEMTCAEAIRHGLREKGASLNAYGIFDGSKIVNADGLPNTTATTAIVLDNVYVSNSYCPQYNKGLACTKPLTYYSGQYMAKNNLGLFYGIDSDGNNIQSIISKSCLTPNNILSSPTPRINVSIYNFPYTGDLASESKMTIKGVNVHFNYTTTINRAIEFINSEVSIGSGSTLILSGASTDYIKSFTKEASSPNAESARISGGNLEINTKLRSIGYDYDLRNVLINANPGYAYGAYFSGTSSQRILFKADYLSLPSGVSAFNYANVYAKNTCIGCNISNGDLRYGTNPFNGARPTFMSIYNTDWILYKDLDRYNLYIRVWAALSSPPSGNLWPGITYVGSRILYTTMTTSGKSHAASRKYGSDCNERGYIYFMNNNGTITTNGTDFADSLLCDTGGSSSRDCEIGGINGNGQEWDAAGGVCSFYNL